MAAVEQYPNAMDVALTTCGFDATQRQRLIQGQGLSTFTNLARYKDDGEVEKLATRLGRLPTNAVGHTGRILINAIQLKNLQMLVWWVREQRKLGTALTALDPALFTDAVIAEGEERKEVQTSASNSSINIGDLPPFNPDDFDECERALRNLLAGKIGVRHETLDYVVRPRDVPATFVDNQEQRKFNISLAGADYDNDNRQVYTILESYLSGNRQAVTWRAQQAHPVCQTSHQGQVLQG